MSSSDPRDLAQRWRDRAADMENGDGASRLAAYHLRFAADELDGLGLRIVEELPLPIPAWLERERGQWQDVINDWADAYAKQSRELDELKGRLAWVRRDRTT